MLHFPMNNLSDFLKSNLNTFIKAPMNKMYKSGISNTHLIDTVCALDLDPIFYARFLYIKNLALVEPQPFHIPPQIASVEKALMLLSFNDYEGAINSLGLDLKYEIIGADATTRAGAQVNRFVVHLVNTSSKEQHEFITESHKYNGFQVQPLNPAELVFLYIKMKQLHANEEDRSLLNFHMIALLERALFEKNSLNIQFIKVFSLFKAEFTDSLTELENISESVVHLDDSIFASPIVFRSDVDIQLGVSLMRKFDYGAAYGILKNYPLYSERVDCLIALRRSQEAAMEVENHIQLIAIPQNREERMLLSGLYIKLGHLFQDTSYFDKAAQTFCSAKPFQLKGLWLFNNKHFIEAEVAFRRALEITPCNEEIRYSYGCTLVELDRILEALKIFKLLKAENQQNENISKNLSYCYYKLNEVENSLNTLKSIALQDHQSMKQFICISAKNNLIDNVIWAFQRTRYDAILSEIANYLVQNGAVSISDLKKSLEQNTYISIDQIKHILFLM